MSRTASSAIGPVSLEQLIALNDEMAALARAGVPLDQGLLHLGRDLPGRLGRIATTVAQRLHQGQDLAHALDDASLPPAYRAVVTAGLRSGRLALALEAMASLLRRVAQSRRLVIGALVYPLLVLAVAYSLFRFTVSKCLPVMARLYESDYPDHPIAVYGRWLTQNATFWLSWLPLVVVGALLLWWLRTRSATWLEYRGTARAWAKDRPSVKNLIYAGRVATFAEVLAVLIEQQVPLPDAVSLAADASGDRRWREAGRTLAEQLRRGEQPSTAVLARWPPLLRWLLLNRVEHGSAALRRIAASYRRRAEAMARLLSVYLPLWLTVAIGGTAAICYAVIVVVPWSELMYVMSQP